MADKSIPELLEDEFGYDGGRYLSLNSLTELKAAFAIIDDAAATRQGLEDLKNSDLKAITKAALKQEPPMTVDEYINDKARKAEEMSHAKAEVVHSYIRNLFDDRDI